MTFLQVVASVDLLVGGLSIFDGQYETAAAFLAAMVFFSLWDIADAVREGHKS